MEKLTREEFTKKVNTEIGKFAKKLGFKETKNYNCGKSWANKDGEIGLDIDDGCIHCTYKDISPNYMKPYFRQDEDIFSGIYTTINLKKYINGAKTQLLAIAKNKVTGKSD